MAPIDTADDDVTIGKKFTFSVETRGDTTIRTGEVRDVLLSDLTQWLGKALGIKDPPGLPGRVAVDRLVLAITTTAGGSPSKDYRLQATLDFTVDATPVRIGVLRFHYGSDTLDVEADVTVGDTTKGADALMCLSGTLERIEGAWSLRADWRAGTEGVHLTDLARAFGVG